MKKRVCTAIVVVGVSGLVAQILLLRELLIVYSGNELSIGIILANWLILEAFGSFFFGRMAEKFKRPLEAFTVLTILFSGSLLIAVFLARILKGAIGISIGESIGIAPMLYSSFLILLPVSMFHGALFTFSCRIYSLFSGRDASPAGRVYVYETAGTIIGGIVCTYLFIPFLNTFQASSVLALLNVLACLVLLAPSWREGSYQKANLAALGMLALFSGYAVFGGQADRLHQYSISAQWKGQQIVHYQNSQYGNICILENQGQYIFFLDGIPDIITPVPDMPFVEEFVHLPLLAHPEPAALLLLGGGAGGVINEALKHPSITSIDYAELDPLLLDLLRRFPTPLTEAELNDGRVRIQQIDGHLFLKTTRNTYDLIFIGIMEPSSLQANRFFTKEFFSRAEERLNAGGMLVLGLPGSLTYMNDELKNLNSSLYHTLKSVFSSIRVIPGDGTNLFIASDSPEIMMINREQIIERVYRRDIEAEVIVPWHIENKLHRGWQDWFSRFLEGGSSKINTDLKPLGLFYSIAHWNALYAPSLRGLFQQLEKIDLTAIVFLFGVILLLYFLYRLYTKRDFRGGIPLTIMTTGFAGMLFDLLLIFAFQSLYGYVFSWIGLLVASFMAGTASGAMLIMRALERREDGYRLFIKVDLAILFFSLGCPLLFHAAHAVPAGSGAFVMVKALFLAISFIGGLLIGAQFPLANALYLKEGAGVTRTAGTLYASDLLGGWFGGIVGAVALLPVIGLTGTCITVGLLKLTSFIIVAGGRPAGQRP